MKTFYEIKKLQAEAQDYGKIAGLRYEMSGDLFCAVLHSTDIVRVSKYGSVFLATGGSARGYWRTAATQKAMNQVLNGLAVVKFKKDGSGTITFNDKPTVEHAFAEGFTFDAETLEVLSAGNDGDYEAWKDKR